MMDSIRYEIWTPFCGTCERPEEMRGTVVFRLDLRYLLEAVGFEDWPVWKEQPTKVVAETFRKVREKLGQDAITYAELDIPGHDNYSHRQGWNNYTSLMQDLERLINHCETFPKGTVKVNWT